jgi:hypothetical protein
MPTHGYLSQAELPLTFGLGNHDHVESVQIQWPGGRTQAVGDLKIDALNVVRESAPPGH